MKYWIQAFLHNWNITHTDAVVTFVLIFSYWCWFFLPYLKVGVNYKQTLGSLSQRLELLFKYVFLSQQERLFLIPSTLQNQTMTNDYKEGLPFQDQLQCRLLTQNSFAPWIHAADFDLQLQQKFRSVLCEPLASAAEDFSPEMKGLYPWIGRSTQICLTQYFYAMHGRKRELV